MADYTSNAINAYDALDSKGNLYGGWKGWHAQSPIIIASGSVKFERKTEKSESINGLIVLIIFIAFLLFLIFK